MAGNETSKFIAMILRHKPEVIGITLDEHGWADVGELIAGIAKKQPFTREMLEEIVAEDEKQRYSFNEDKTLIRANQGHSIPVDVELEEKEPPRYLYHGTGEKYVSSIEEIGLIPKSRLHVHLSAEYSTAENVGTRHGKPVVYRIWAGKMYRDGYKFYQSVNGVWLTEKVPPQYFKRDSFDVKLVQNIADQIKEAFADENTFDRVEEEIIPKYGWEYVQQALFSILLDDTLPEQMYENAANVIFGAVLDGRKIKKKTTIGLLYYRLGDVNYPNDDNTIWSITSNLYGLDYCNSYYNPLKDEKILNKLASYGIHIK